jgi:signal transduction histidine kinase
MNSQLLKKNFDRIFLVAIGLVTLVILVLSTISFIREREVISSFSMAGIKVQGNRLRTEMESRSQEMAQACLADPVLRSLAASIPSDIDSDLSFGTKVRNAARKYEIADNIFISVDGHMAYPLLKPWLSLSSSADAIGSRSPSELQFTALLHNADEEMTKGSHEKAIAILEECSNLPVSENLKSKALERLARSLMQDNKPTQAVRVWHRLENEFPDLLSEACEPYALIAPLEISGLASETRRNISNSLSSPYLDLIKGRWPLRVDVTLNLKTMLERQLGSAIPKYHDTPYLRQTRIANEIDLILREDTFGGTYRVYSRSVLDGTGRIPIFYMVLSERNPRRIMAISVDPEWIAGPLLIMARANLKPGNSVLSSFEVKPLAGGSALSFQFITTYPHLELQFPEEAVAAGRKSATFQLWMFAGSAVLMLSLLIIVSIYLVHASREQMLIQTRSDFLGHISHELKTPLTLMRLYAETLFTENDLSEDDRRACLRIVMREATRLNHLIDNLLQLSMIERAKIVYKMVEGDLGAVVAKTAQVCVDWMKQQEIELKATIAPDLPPVIFDQERVVQALINLVENARKYGESKPIEMRLWAEGSSVILEVEDHGIGVEEDEQRKVFNQYYRATNVGSQRGSGLGLYLVSETMKAHKGEIELKSEVGKGSCFRLIFPASAAVTDRKSITSYLHDNERKESKETDPA